MSNQSCGVRGVSTFLHDGISLSSINLLASDDVAGGIGEVNELALGVKVQSSGVHQILYGDHVLVWNLGVHVHAPDDPRATFTVDQEELVLGFCSRTEEQKWAKSEQTVSNLYR